MEKLYDIIIIGSGPAGYTAAIYAARANLSVLMLQGYQVGGQLMLTSDVENYPGFEEGILGPPMMEKFEAQARRLRIRVSIKRALSSSLRAPARSGWDYLANSVCKGVA